MSVSHTFKRTPPLDRLSLSITSCRSILILATVVFYILQHLSSSGSILSALYPQYCALSSPSSSLSSSSNHSSFPDKSHSRAVPEKEIYPPPPIPPFSSGTKPTSKFGVPVKPIQHSSFSFYSSSSSSSSYDHSRYQNNNDYIDPQNARRRRPRKIHASVIDQLYEDLNAYTAAEQEQEQGQQQYQQHDWQSSYPSEAASDYTFRRHGQYIVGSHCGGYYCAETDTCVQRPIQCPCPSTLDVKVFRGDWYVCYRGSQRPSPVHQ